MRKRENKWKGEKRERRIGMRDLERGRRKMRMEENTERKKFGKKNKKIGAWSVYKRNCMRLGKYSRSIKKSEER